MSESTETIITPDTIKLSFGMSVPGHIPGPIWAARAIMQSTYNWSKLAFTKAGKLRKKAPPRYTIDIPHDRHELVNASHEEGKALMTWVQKVGLPGLTAAVDGAGVEPRDNTEVHFRKDGYVIKGNPRKSYGYLYIVAHKDFV